MRTANTKPQNMPNQISSVAVLLLLNAVLTVTIAAPNADKYCACDEASISRKSFPDDFIFGSASAAYQVEGGCDEDGAGQTMWGNYTHSFPEKIKDHSNGDVATDSYHMYKEDVRILKNMGADAYRFSISWARILPGGSLSKGVNQAGIDYYNALIDELLSNGIQPMVTIFHLDTPQALEDSYGGFLSSRIVADFRDFADLLFREFGDRVKYWITINEPWALSYLGYTVGVFAPARCSSWLRSDCLGGDSGTEPYKVNHNQLLAHASAVALYRSKYQKVQKGKIGIVIVSFWFVPYDREYESQRSRDRALEFMVGWTMDPVTFGRYPESMRERVGDRLPEFTEEEADMLKGSFDFIGLNYYTAYYAISIPAPPRNRASYSTDSGSSYTGYKNGIPIGKPSSNGRYFSYPKGLSGLLRYMKLKYNDPVIYITENGYGATGNEMSEAMNDHDRKKYFVDHLCCLREAIEQEGANVKGYFPWTLMDNFNWASGYLVRFGVHYVDFKDATLRRHPNLSTQWLKSVFARVNETGNHVSDI